MYPTSTGQPRPPEPCPKPVDLYPVSHALTAPASQGGAPLLNKTTYPVSHPVSHPKPVLSPEVLAAIIQGVEQGLKN